MISLKTLFLLTVCVCLAFSQDSEGGEEEGAGEAGEAGNDTDGLNSSDALAAEGERRVLRTPIA